jgi:hypothetical protein
MDEMHGRILEHSAARLDGLIGPLAGLMCWDLAQDHKMNSEKAPATRAIEDALKAYPTNIRAVGFDAMRKNYNIARVKINDATIAYNNGVRPTSATDAQGN